MSMLWYYMNGSDLHHLKERLNCASNKAAKCIIERNWKKETDG